MHWLCVWISYWKERVIWGMPKRRTTTHDHARPPMVAPLTLPQGPQPLPPLSRPQQDWAAPIEGATQSRAVPQGLQTVAVILVFKYTLN